MDLNVPEHYTVASKVTTLDYLWLMDFPPLRCMLEILDSTPLGNLWYLITLKEQHKTIKQIVEWET
ncbi:hypothetical protein Y699_09251 [Aspergillus fumigatus Z5]|nr:hypothetical protein Y699_09251 [Aspergillus fumigatus Z5]